MDRIERITKHLQPQRTRGIITNETDEVQLPVKYDGWGFHDSELRLNSKGLVELSGSRYLYSGKEFPSLRSWLETNAGLNIDNTSPSKPITKYPVPIKNEAFLQEIAGHYYRLSFNNEERLLHAHGHTAQEMWMLKFTEVPRIPDAVIWPESHEDVERLVAAAVKHNVAIIPYGGGTCVSQALLCPVNETRMIISVDMKQMNKIVWVNKKNMQACIQAGAVGKDLEAQLNQLGVVLGHEPDSWEFSTLGGWIATRASGMRKNRYGNIEDIILHFKVVTSTGTVQKSVSSSRISAGPDLHHIFLGSEGCFGIVTEATVRIRPKPEVTKYGSIIFPTFKHGVDCLYEIAIKRCAPVSIRLVDNMQFQFGQALKPGGDGKWKEFMDGIKKWYVLNAMKFDPNTMTAATLLFEGDAEEVAAQEKQVYGIASKYGGMSAGEENGVRGYFLTYIIAYLRDLGFRYQFIAESFETTVPHANVYDTCERVKAHIYATCKELGVKHKPFVSCRVTQLYDTSAAIYFYFGFVWEGLQDPCGTYSKIEHAAREEILRCGGTISHHHGVGKLRAGFMKDTYSPEALALLKNLKQTIDPQNIFAAGNLIFGDKTH